AGLEVHDSRIGVHRIQDRDRVTPRILGRGTARDRAGGLLGDRDVVARVCHVVFVELRIAGLGEDLIDPASQHDVTAQKQRDHRLSRCEHWTAGEWRASMAWWTRARLLL